jgi:exosome complex RNA-binding protein Rrp42 (RNase PH superfamily)
MRRLAIAFSAFLLVFTGCSSDSDDDGAADISAMYCDLLREFEEILLDDDVPDEEKVAQGLTIYGETTRVMPVAIRPENRILLDPESDEEEVAEAQATVNEFQREECGVDMAALRPMIDELVEQAGLNATVETTVVETTTTVAD